MLVFLFFTFVPLSQLSSHWLVFTNKRSEQHVGQDAMLAISSLFRLKPELLACSYTLKVHCNFNAFAAVTCHRVCRENCKRPHFVAVFD